MATFSGLLVEFALGKYNFLPEVFSFPVIHRSLSPGESNLSKGGHPMTTQRITAIKAMQAKIASTADVIDLIQRSTGLRSDDKIHLNFRPDVGIKTALNRHAC